MPEFKIRRPAARASAARDNVAFTERYRPGTLAAIRSTIPPESLEKLDKSSGFSWLEFEHDHWLMDGTISVLGVEDSVDCWRRSVANLIEQPLLRNFVEGTLRLFGTKSGKVIKMIPKGWPLAYRDFCTPTFRPLNDYSAELRFEDIAPQAFDSVGYLHCWHGICQGVFDLERPKEGRVDFKISREKARAVATFHWA